MPDAGQSVRQTIVTDVGGSILREPRDSSNYRDKPLCGERHQLRHASFMGLEMSARCRPSLRAAAAAFGIAAALAVCALLLLPAAVDAQAGASRTVSLKQRLTFGLQARRPSEKQFIDAVVDTVERGRLPVRLVDRTFFWARERAPKQAGKFARRPIIYFQPALTIQATRLRIDIRQDAPVTPAAP